MKDNPISVVTSSSLDELEQAEKLIAAAVNNNSKEVKQLLKKGITPNVISKAGTTPLHWAVLNKNAKMAKILLDMGADPKIQDGNGCKALQLIESSKIKFEEQVVESLKCAFEPWGFLNTRTPIRPILNLSTISTQKKPVSVRSMIQANKVQATADSTIPICKQEETLEEIHAKRSHFESGQSIFSRISKTIGSILNWLLVKISRAKISAVPQDATIFRASCKDAANKLSSDINPRFNGLSL